VEAFEVWLPTATVTGTLPVLMPEGTTTLIW
jgi:hypothetical protein